MQFVVPQFIEVESKVIGPISVRQFIILLFTAGIIFVEFELFSFWVFAILGVITLAVGGIFAFLKINSQPFHIFFLTLIQTLKRPHLAVWHRQPSVIKVVTKVGRKDRKDRNQKGTGAYKPAVSESHLAELSLIMDTGGKYSPEDLQRLLEEQRVQKVDTTKPKL